MNQRNTSFSLPTHLFAFGVAALLTVSQLGAVDAIAQKRSVSVHAQVVQFDRVVVTGQRAATAQADDLVRAVRLSACAPVARAAC